MPGIITASKINASVDFTHIQNVPSFATESLVSAKLAVTESVLNQKLNTATSGMLTQNNFETLFGGNIEQFADSLDTIQELEEALDNIHINNNGPLVSTASGTPGEMRFRQSGADHYMYVCVATNTWKRSKLASW